MLVLTYDLQDAFSLLIEKLEVTGVLVVVSSAQKRAETQTAKIRRRQKPETLGQPGHLQSLQKALKSLLDWSWTLKTEAGRLLDEAKREYRYFKQCKYHLRSR
jgi:3,4-dihydroxy-2-butanone 4-phosphate synthase